MNGLLQSLFHAGEFRREFCQNIARQIDKKRNDMTWTVRVWFWGANKTHLTSYLDLFGVLVRILPLVNHHQTATIFGRIIFWTFFFSNHLKHNNKVFGDHWGMSCRSHIHLNPCMRNPDGFQEKIQGNWAWTFLPVGWGTFEKEKGHTFFHDAKAARPAQVFFLLKDVLMIITLNMYMCILVIWHDLTSFDSPPRSHAKAGCVQSQILLKKKWTLVESNWVKTTCFENKLFEMFASIRGYLSGT